MFAKIRQRKTYNIFLQKINKNINCIINKLYVFYVCVRALYNIFIRIVQRENLVVKVINVLYLDRHLCNILLRFNAITERCLLAHLARRIHDTSYHIYMLHDKRWSNIETDRNASAHTKRPAYPAQVC